MVTIDDRDITIIQSNDSTAVIMVVSAVCVLLIIALALFIRFLYNKMRSEKAHAEQIRMTQKSIHSQQDIKVVPREKNAYHAKV